MMKEEMNGNMKKLFKGYYEYDVNEYKELLEKSIIIPDTNVLLDLHRYSKQNSDLVMEALKKYEDRLWIPYEVGKEYFKNKDNLIANCNAHYDNVQNEFKESIQKIDEIFSKINIFKEDSDDSRTLKNTIKKLDKDFKKLIENDKTTIKNDKDVEKFIINLFENKIGNPNDSKVEEEIRVEGLRRFEKDIPPGYKDKDKYKNVPEEDRINGDYHIFASIISHSKKTEKDIIFITNDTKDDMYLKLKGKTIKGRPELLNEFYLETNKILQLYTTDQFLKKIYVENQSKNSKKHKEDVGIIEDIKQFRQKDENNNKYYQYLKKDLIEDIYINNYFNKDSYINEYYTKDVIVNEFFDNYTKSSKNKERIKQIKIKKAETLSYLLNYIKHEILPLDNKKDIINNLKKILINIIDEKMLISNSFDYNKIQKLLQRLDKKNFLKSDIDCFEIDKALDIIMELIKKEISKLNIDL